LSAGLRVVIVAGMSPGRLSRIFRTPLRRRQPRLHAATLACAFGLLLAPGLAQARPTYVSLTFDDGSADQMAALPILAEHGMNATFYAVSGQLGNVPYYMTWDQLAQVAEAGNEIGGHTRTHRDLTTLTPAEQVAEVCGDREALFAHGHQPVSFAYPFANWDASSRAAVQSCGYTSGRGVGGTSCLPGCPPAESVPPSDPFVLRTPPGITDTTSVATLQGYVTRAVQNGGGWLTLTFHNICDSGCGSNGTSAANLDALLDWLQAQPANEVSVRTVRQVMALPAPPPPANLLQNPGLENGLTATGLSCWQRTASGTNTATWSHSSDAHSGANAETVTITSHTSGDQKLVSAQDPAATPNCSPAGIPGHVYDVGAWYKTSAGANVRMVAYYRDAAGAWQFWREQVVPASTDWRRASWQTPALPSGATAIGIGFSLRSAGTATVDDFTLGDLNAAPPSYADAVAADAPSHRWRLGEASGTTMTAAAGQPGSYQNGVVLGQPGAPAGDADTAARLDGTSSYGYVNNVAAPQSAYSMEILMKAEPDVQPGSLMSHGGGGALYIGTDRFCFRQTATDVCWMHAPSPGQWYHVAGTWDSTSKIARLYVNGIERAAATAPSAPSGSGTLYVGYGQFAPWFRGVLDEPAYYATALGADRIAAHYAACGC
jgi:peptidoglycan/xylan/chitin deacetylase (PgdA/CDA1 family)